MTFPYVMCTPKTCISQVTINDAFVKALKQGRAIGLGLSRGGKKIEVEIPLTGFTTAYGGAPTVSAEELGAFIGFSTTPAQTKSETSSTADNRKPTQTAAQLLALGTAYESGNGQPQDDAQAAKYYEMAVDIGSVGAMRSLAAMYRTGRGVTADASKAEELYRGAAIGGDAEAEYTIATDYTQNTDDKITWLRRAGLQNQADAVAMLKQMGVPPIEPTASSVLSLQWSKLCDEVAATKCLLRRDVVDADGKMAAALKIYLSSARAPVTLEALVPGSAVVQHSTSWRFGSFRKEVPYSYCLRDYCVARLNTDQTTLRSLANAAKFEVDAIGVSDAAPRTYTIDLSGLSALLKISGMIGDPSIPSPSVDLSESFTSPWFAQCATSIRGSRICGASKVVIDGASFAGSLSIYNDSQGPNINLIMPPGVSIPKQITVGLSDGTTYPVSFMYCVNGACSAWMPGTLLDTMFRSGEITVLATDEAGSELRWTYDLSGVQKVLESNP
jgi:invasion protein IalB